MFLDRHPFSDREFLEEVFGEKVFKYLLPEAEGRFKTETMNDLGELLAHKKEPRCILLGMRRYEVARRFAFNAMGKHAVINGMSPGFEADGEFPWNEKWIRAWVDLGGCSVESLGFIRNPPVDFSDFVKDVVLTTQRDRMETLANQVDINWGGGQTVFVWLYQTNEYRKVRTRRWASKTKEWTPYTQSDFDTHLRMRRRGDARKSLLGNLAIELAKKDWDILNLVGNMPLLNVYELAYIESDKRRKMEVMIERIKILQDLELVETAVTRRAKDQVQERKVLTTLGLEMLAGHWGTTTQIMRRFHPWPQKTETPSRKRNKYSTDLLSRLREHQQLVNEFVLALLYGARCVSNSIGGATVEIGTTIGSRILYRADIGRHNERTKVIAPDAIADATIWKRGWLDGATTDFDIPVVKKMLLIEVDKATIRLNEISKRIQKYGEVWGSLRGEKPALVWVIDGSPYRESKIIEMMQENDVEGWTALTERLVLPEGDPWWLIYTPAKLNLSDVRMGLSYKAIGGMAPWRDVWISTGTRGEQPFMGVKTWEGRELSEGRPEREEGGWIRHENCRAVTMTEDM